MDSGAHFDPDAMAQQHADQAQSNQHFNSFQTTQGNTEIIKPEQMPQKKKNNLLPQAPFFPIPVLLTLNKHGIAIEISGEYLIHHDSKTFTNYKIQGYGANGEFETAKAFVDFERVREKLLRSHRGTIIPDLPYAVPYCKYDEREIESKRDGLLIWLKKMADLPDLFYYSDFQDFLLTGPSSPNEQVAWIERYTATKNEPVQQNFVNKNGIAIYIAGESLKHNGISLYAEYLIKGSENNNAFAALKTYLDFAQMREKLVKRFTGCRIPALPSASLFTNYYDGADNVRREGLMKFLQEAAEVRYLFYSELFQHFLGIGKNAFKPQNAGGGNMNVMPNFTQLSTKVESLQSLQIPQHNYQNQVESVPSQVVSHLVTIVGEFQRSNMFGFSHTEYHIRGTDPNGMFEVNRRYTDFVLIREVLVEKWPNIKFQELPPTKRRSEDEETFRVMRGKGLISFMQSIALLYNVFQSLEWQVFIKDPSPKIADKLKSFKKPSSFFRIVIGD